MDAPITLEVLGAIVAIMCGLGGAVWMIRSGDLERFRQLEQKISDVKLEVAQNYASAEGLNRTEGLLTTAVNALRVELRQEIKEMRNAFVDAVGQIRK